MIISAIVAVAQNGIIGINGKIPWHLPADLAWFKENTLGHHVIMGRNSFQSIGRPLPKRTNIVITRDPLFHADGVLIAHSLEDALDMASNNQEKEAFIIGGGQIYQESINLWDKLYITEVKVESVGDVYFPKINFSKWAEIWREDHLADHENEFNFSSKILCKNNIFK